MEINQKGIAYEDVKSKFGILYRDHWWDLAKAVMDIWISKLARNLTI
jgi:hypothetical protein